MNSFMQEYIKNLTETSRLYNFIKVNFSDESSIPVPVKKLLDYFNTMDLTIDYNVYYRTSLSINVNQDNIFQCLGGENNFHQDGRYTPPRFNDQSISVLYCYPRETATLFLTPKQNEKMSRLLSMAVEDSVDGWKPLDSFYKELSTLDSAAFISQRNLDNSLITSNVCKYYHRGPDYRSEPDSKKAVLQAGGRCLINLYFIPK